MGALTSFQYAFRARPWEIKSFDTNDFLTPFLSPIILNLRDEKILRVLPRIIKEHTFISNQTRFGYEALKTQRLVNPYISQGYQWEKASFMHAYSILNSYLNNINLDYSLVHLNAVAGPLVSFNVAVALKTFVSRKNQLSLLSGAPLPARDFLSNPDLEKLLDASIPTCILILNTNLKDNFPLIDAKLQSFARYNNLIFSIGSHCSTYAKNLGNINTLISLTRGHAKVNKFLSLATKIIIFSGLLYNDMLNLNLDITLLKRLNKYSSNIFLYTLYKYTSSPGLHYLNFSNKPKLKKHALFSFNILLNSYGTIVNTDIAFRSFYFSSHSIKKASSFNTILIPIPTVFESKAETYLDIEQNFIKFEQIQQNNNNVFFKFLSTIIYT